MLTLGEVRDSLPANFRNNITGDMVDQLNSLSADPEEARAIRDNFVSFSQVLMEGRYKVGDYVRAVMYVSHKVMGKSNMQSYMSTFPERYQSMIDRKKELKDISSIVSAYNKGALVTKVLERAIVPSWILNQGMFQSALQTQHDLMMDDEVSDKVRCEAANSLLTHLKKPETLKAELKIEIGLNDGMAALEASLVEMSERQLNSIAHDPNVSANDMATKTMKVINP
jgi:hypothetical protein